MARLLRRRWLALVLASASLGGCALRPIWNPPTANATDTPGRTTGGNADAAAPALDASSDAGGFVDCSAPDAGCVPSTDGGSVDAAGDVPPVDAHDPDGNETTTDGASPDVDDAASPPTDAQADAPTDVAATDDAPPDDASTHE